jgi:transcription-repair coupling factor (superfamily II helicase)
MFYQFNTESSANSFYPTDASKAAYWIGLHGDALPLAIAETAMRQSSLVVVFTENLEQSSNFAAAIRFFLQGISIPVIELPDWETLPYDVFSPHQDIISERLSTLASLPNLKQGVLLVAVNTALMKMPPVSYLHQNSFDLKTQQTFKLSEERKRLEKCGYQFVDSVREHGEFTVRGSIVDVFPMGSDQPVRVELFDEEIETLRYFDAETQLSVAVLSTLKLLPAREMPLNDASIAFFKKRFAEFFAVNPRQCSFYQDVMQGIAFGGIEYYLPLFFEATMSLWDYLPDNAMLVVMENLQSRIAQFHTEVKQRFEDRRHQVDHPILEPKHIVIAENDFLQAIKQFPRIVITPSQVSLPSYVRLFATEALPDIAVDTKTNQPWQALKNFLQNSVAQKNKILLCAESAGRKQILLELMAKLDFSFASVSGWTEFLNASHLLAITEAPLNKGFKITSSDCSVIAENQLFGRRVAQSRRQKHAAADQNEFIFRSLTELKLGSPVVHLDHGVGRYQGLKTLEIDGQSIEFLVLEYADTAKLYVPVDALHLIARYSGVDPDLAPLHRLGNPQWQKEKRKAAEKIHDVAAELLNIYAARAAKPGFSYELMASDYALFAAHFPFEETIDQANAISKVLEDMQSSRPMDRLVCGDVGFGKTEVAMRATFIAVQNHRQVAVLVPTTLLAQQHYHSFKDRFADWPVNIEVLSRFKNPKEQQVALEQLKNGKIDIIIGTHKLLQTSVKFHNLGLLIIDEEHRFGVKHKEILKSLRTDVDILTMTATPIPRTLNMALSGVRDISIIATPPDKRLSIKTFVRVYELNIIKEAVLRELRRGGQVYFLHNEVRSIEHTAEKLRELIPEARVGLAHGQMRERELEAVMADFYHRRFNILVCTTIIETGIDVPTANTIIIERADKLGLAQLHQLRGRVGRSHHQAYAYLLTPPPTALSNDAIKRLDVISEAQHLGAGFTLASNDLEIRGSGELLGDEQSGHIQSIGYSLFMEMLDQTIHAIKAGKTPNLDQPFQLNSEVNLRVPALIPEQYLNDVNERLILYKRIASSKTENDLEIIQVEMIDRFGLLPEQVNFLFKVTALRQKAQSLGVSKIDFASQGGVIDFAANTKVNPLALVKLVQRFPQQYKLMGANKLRASSDLQAHQSRITFVEQLLDTLSAAT